MWQELEDTIGSLKSQISSLQQRCAILQDELDYRAIPWRSGRFDSEALTRASATEA